MLYQKSNNYCSYIGLLTVVVVCLIELFRDAGFSGDFIGYVNAGNAVLQQQNIYQDYLNTWPPLFSIFSVPLALGDQLSPYMIRFFWLLGTLIAMVHIIQMSVKLFLRQELRLIAQETYEIDWKNLLVVLPLLFSLRYIMDNMANVQINIFMLWLSLFAVVNFTKGNYKLVSICLAISIALKVYTIFFFLYFLYKREWQVCLWSFIFFSLLNSLSFVVFGAEQAIEYYSYWLQEVTPRSYIAHHKNQSIFGVFLRLLTDAPLQDGGMPYKINLINWATLTNERVRLITYLFVAICSIFPAFLFWKKTTQKDTFDMLIQYSILFTIIPLLSPIAWKAYFIFLWIPLFLLYFLLYHSKTSLPLNSINYLRYIFLFAVSLITFSSELFIGKYFSDVLETYSIITLGTIILLLIQLFIFTKRATFELEKTEQV